MTNSKQVAMSIIEALRMRSGFDNLIDNLDKAIKQEIIDEIAQIIKEESI